MTMYVLPAGLDGGWAAGAAGAAGSHVTASLYRGDKKKGFGFAVALGGRQDASAPAPRTTTASHDRVDNGPPPRERASGALAGWRLCRGEGCSNVNVIERRAEGAKKPFRGAKRRFYRSG